MKQNHSSSFSVVSNNIISLLSNRKKESISESFLCMFFWENKGIICYKLCEENKSIKLQMLALKKKIVTFASSTYYLMNLKWTKFNVKHHSNPDRLDKQ